jgi:hypothetical protein
MGKYPPRLTMVKIVEFDRRRPERLSEFLEKPAAGGSHRS